MPGQQAANLLQTGPGRRHNAHRPGSEPVSKAERHAVEQGGSRARPHQQQPMVASIGLEADLVLQRHIVAEKKDVQTTMEGIPHLGSSVAAGHGNDGHIGLGVGLDRAAQRLGPRLLAPTRLALLVAASSRPRPALCRPQRRRRTDGDDQVIGGRRSASAVSKPTSLRMARLAAVDITTAASSTPGSLASSRATSMRVTES